MSTDALTETHLGSDKPDINSVAASMLDRINNYKVIETGCWIHLNKPLNTGYVVLRYKASGGSHLYLAHRLSYAIYVGTVIEGMDICHTCDVRNCVNPKHLFQGTRQTNLQDMRKKRRGSVRGHAQVSESEERFIKLAREKGLSQREIAEIVGITQAGVSLVLKRLHRGS